MAARRGQEARGRMDEQNLAAQAIHAPVEDTSTPLGIKALVVALLFVLLAELAMLAQALVRAGLMG